MCMADRAARVWRNWLASCLLCLILMSEVSSGGRPCWAIAVAVKQKAVARRSFILYVQIL